MRRISLACVSTLLCDFSDLFNFFYFSLFNIWRLGGMKIFFWEISEKKISITNRGNAARRKKKLLCSISGVCLGKKRTQSENWQRRMKQKDIKLKVVKTSSRFSIYFQLHFAFLLGVFRKCVFSSLFSRNNSVKIEQKLKSQSV